MATKVAATTHSNNYEVVSAKVTQDIKNQIHWVPGGER